MTSQVYGVSGVPVQRAAVGGPVERPRFLPLPRCPCEGPTEREWRDRRNAVVGTDESFAEWVGAGSHRAGRGRRPRRERAAGEGSLGVLIGAPGGRARRPNLKLAALRPCGASRSDRDTCHASLGDLDQSCRAERRRWATRPPVCAPGARRRVGRAGWTSMPSRGAVVGPAGLRRATDAVAACGGGTRPAGGHRVQAARRTGAVFTRRYLVRTGLGSEADRRAPWQV